MSATTLGTLEHVKPGDIETRSFEIIAEELRQRGISLDEARLLLEFAFINEVIDTIRLEPLKDRLHYLVEKRFRGELNKCEGCKLCH